MHRPAPLDVSQDLAVIAILAALATGIATVATKVVMLGQSYGRNEMGVDIAMTAAGIVL